jgi:hypothetical protein
MMTMGTWMLLPAMVLTAATMAGCGGKGDPSVRRATELCLQEAAKLTGNVRTTTEAGCGKMQTYCNDEARRKEPLCQQFLLRYK